ncbi:hypothetical protein [Actinoplanes sp. NPDC051411]|uniref:hypothetical protein n=1 Tax=Actinoplanes sp. NPDC051411 TaxID=3155522 RepID=UPI0034348374
MSALVLVLAVVVLLVWVARPARLRGRRGPATEITDGPSRLLGWAVRALPADRASWGEAMFGELHEMRNRRQRWRFAAGCAGAAILLPSRRADFAGLAARLMAATALACAGLVAYGLTHYPAILTLPGTWPVLAIFASVLAGYTAIAAALARRGPVARPGLIGGLGLAAVWIIAGIPVAHFLLPAIPIASLAAGAIVARRRSTTAVRHQIALFSALAAGLVVFLAYAGDTLLTAGGPTTPGSSATFRAAACPTWRPTPSTTTSARR